MGPVIPGNYLKFSLALSRTRESLKMVEGPSRTRKSLNIVDGPRKLWNFLKSSKDMVSSHMGKSWNN